jgi:hypothetical protein
MGVKRCSLAAVARRHTRRPGITSNVAFTTTATVTGRPSHSPSPEATRGVRLTELRNRGELKRAHLFFEFDHAAMTYRNCIPAAEPRELDAPTAVLGDPLVMNDVIPH